MFISRQGLVVRRYKWGRILSQRPLEKNWKSIEGHRMGIVWTFIGNRMDFWLSIIIVYFHTMDIVSIYYMDLVVQLQIS
jgi:hypothetical protein